MTAVVNTLMSLRVVQNMESFYTSRGSVTVSRNILLLEFGWLIG